MSQRKWVIAFRDTSVPVGIYRDFSFGVITRNFHDSSVGDKLKGNIETLISCKQANPIAAAWWVSAETSTETIANFEREIWLAQSP
jgi:hypothetical protein